jgi:hypothetical protein
MFDIGADQGEIMEHAWNKLHEYYVFDAFKRERWAAYRGANPMGYYNRIKSRWLPPYEDVGRLGAIIFNLFRPWPEFMDLINWNELVGRKWVEWTERALRDLTQMITSPAPGSFKLVDKGTENERYQNFSYQTGEPGSELDIFIGDGKFPYTTYWDGAGYYYFDHAAWVGSFWEKMAALDTLTYSMGYFLSNYMGEQVDVGVGTSVGFNTTHYTELTNLLAGFLVGDRDYYAPYVEQGSVRFIDPVRPWESWGKPRVEPSIEGLAMQAYMGLFGCAYVQSGFDPGFVDAVYVCIKGSGNCYEIVTDENPEDGVTGVQTIEYYDEWSKKTYLARTANYDPVRINGSYALLQEANALKGEYDDIEWGESPETDAKKMELQAQLGNMRDLLDVLVTLNEIFGLMHY